MPIMSPGRANSGDPNAFPAPGIYAGAVITKILNQSEVQINVPGDPALPEIGNFAFYNNEALTFGAARSGS